MKYFVVGICSAFENEVKLFKISAENDYEAVKKTMVEFCQDEEGKQWEIQWQKSEDYPKTLKGLYSIYEEIPFNVIEV